MRASEVIEQIKALDANERAKVRDYLNQPLLEKPRLGRSMDDATFERALDFVMEEHAELFRRLAK